MTPAAPATSRRRTRLWVGGVTIGLPPIVVLAASDTTPEVRPPDDRWRALGVGDNQYIHNGSIFAVLAMAFGSLCWALYTSWQRVRHTDQTHETQQKTWERMLAASEARVVKLETTVEKLIDTVVKNSDTTRDLSLEREKLASVGRVKDQLEARDQANQQRIAELTAAVRAGNGGFVPTPIEPQGMPVHV